MEHNRAAAHRRASTLLAEQLPDTDLSDTDTDALLARVTDYATARQTLHIITGRLIAETHTRGLSIRDIAGRTGLTKSTVDRLAAPFLRGNAA